MTRLAKLVVASAGMAWLALPLLAQDTSCYDQVFNLIQNCGFETGNLTDWSLQPLYDPSTNKTLNASGIGVGDTNGLFNYAPANNGTHAAVFGGPGQITQSISTTPGNNYLASFYLDSEFPNVDDIFFANGNVPATFGTSVINNLSFIVPTSPNIAALGNYGKDIGSCSTSANTAGFVSCEFNFQAVSTEADVSFGDLPFCSAASLDPSITAKDGFYTSLCPNANSGSPLYPFILDDVSVVDCTQHAAACGDSSGGGGPGGVFVPSTPEPGTIVMMLSAIGVLVLVRRVRRMPWRKWQAGTGAPNSERPSGRVAAQRGCPPRLTITRTSGLF